MSAHARGIDSRSRGACREPPFHRRPQRDLGRGAAFSYWILGTVLGEHRRRRHLFDGYVLRTRQGAAAHGPRTGYGSVALVSRHRASLARSSLVRCEAAAVIAGNARDLPPTTD